jgi:hypothetical protein
MVRTLAGNGEVVGPRWYNLVPIERRKKGRPAEAGRKKPKTPQKIQNFRNETGMSE